MLNVSVNTLKLAPSKTIIYIVIIITALSCLFTVQASLTDKVITVQNIQQLHAALRHANKHHNTHIKLAEGVYKTEQSLIIRGNGITLSSVSGNRNQVIITGLGMRQTRDVNNLIRVSGNHFTLDGITLQNAGNHLIQIAGEQNADYPILRNCVLKDGYEQLFKVSYNRKTQVSSDYGLIENCVFSYSAGIGPQYYIGGIDVHGGHNWIVRNNVFKGIASPESKIAEHAIHFWNNTKDTLIEDNIIINCDRGIGFGMTNRPSFGGIIRNNIIVHNASHHPNADVGIVLEESPYTQVLNNKIYLSHSYPNSIEYRFSSTINVLIQGNLTNRPIRKRDGAQAKIIGNQRSRDLKDFLSPQLQAEFLSLQN